MTRDQERLAVAAVTRKAYQERRALQSELKKESEMQMRHTIQHALYPYMVM